MDPLQPQLKATLGVEETLFRSSGQRSVPRTATGPRALGFELCAALVCCLAGERHL